MATLSDEVKMFILQSLACYDTPTQVAESVSSEFGIEIERNQVQKYDPTKSAGKSLAKKHIEVFHATREAFLKDISGIPIASQSFRLRSLQRMHDNAIQRKNYVLAKEILEQAAKEVGGIYTNRVKVGGDADNPLLMLIERFQGTSLPIAYDVEGESELIEVKEPIRWSPK